MDFHAFAIHHVLNGENRMAQKRMDQSIMSWRSGSSPVRGLREGGVLRPFGRPVEPIPRRRVLLEIGLARADVQLGFRPFEGPLRDARFRRGRVELRRLARAGHELGGQPGRGPLAASSARLPDGGAYHRPIAPLGRSTPPSHGPRHPQRRDSATKDCGSPRSPWSRRTLPRPARPGPASRGSRSVPGR